MLAVAKTSHNDAKSFTVQDVANSKQLTLVGQKVIIYIVFMFIISKVSFEMAKLFSLA